MHELYRDLYQRLARLPPEALRHIHMLSITGGRADKLVSPESTFIKLKGNYNYNILHFNTANMRDVLTPLEHN